MPDSLNNGSKLDLSATNSDGDIIFTVPRDVENATLRTGDIGSGVLDLKYKIKGVDTYQASTDYSTGTAIQLTSSKPEVGVPPGDYCVTISTAGNATGRVFIDGV